MQISAVLSIHNRGTLFARALRSYLWQAMGRNEWEIILVDDMSTEDLSHTYRDLIGQINLRHVHFDHTRHTIFRERNPNWKRGIPQDWFHTPALTINAGSALARGKVICLCHPEIIHGPENFENAEYLLRINPMQYLFGVTYLGEHRTNCWLEANADWPSKPWINILKIINKPQLHAFGPNELYWYTSFLPKLAVEAVGGVDFVYLNGVAAEDDDFRDRVKLAGWVPVHSEKIQGLHQDHSDETEPHRRRNSYVWQDGLARNREVYYHRRNNRLYPVKANAKYDWTAMECVVKIVEYTVGSSVGKVTNL